MNMKGKVLVVLNLVVLTTFNCCNSQTNVPGFTLLGHAQNKSIDSENALNYYVSDGVATRSQAFANCVQLFDGRLVTILNKSQLGDILVSLLEAGLIDTNLWTGGAYHEGMWKWITTGVAIESTQLIWRNDPGCGSSPPTLPGLQLSQTGFCNYPLDTQRRYICEL